MEFGYFSEVQAEQFPFFRMPKVMFGDRLFKGYQEMEKYCMDFF